MERPRDRSAYINLRRRYEPERIRLVIIAESPPASGLYFYDETGAPSEPLFAAPMKQLDPSQPRRATKEVGLREFQRRGWLLVDATYEPVNKLGRSSVAGVIERDYPLLRDDLVTLTPRSLGAAGADQKEHMQGAGAKVDARWVQGAQSRLRHLLSR